MKVLHAGWLYHFDNNPPVFSVRRLELNPPYEETELFMKDCLRYCGTCGQWADGPIQCCAHDEEWPFVDAETAVLIAANYPRSKLIAGRMK